MTPFQTNADAHLHHAAAEAGLTFEFARIEGQHERFIRARFDGTSFDLFISEDEAGIQGPLVDYRFEKSDYPTPQHLIDAFVKKAIDLATAASNQAL